MDAVILLLRHRPLLPDEEQPSATAGRARTGRKVGLIIEREHPI